MGKKTSKYLSILIVVILVGGIVALFVGNVKLKRENAELQIQIEKTERKTEALKKKYSEEKAKASSMQRAKMATDSQMRTMESEIETIEGKNDELARSIDALKAEHRKKEEGFNLEIEDRQKKYEALKTKMDERGKILSNAEETIHQQEIQLADMENENSDFRSQLQEATSKIDRVVEHNKNLAKLSMELLAEFDDRGVFQSLMEKEPFTQAKRVDLEQMIQEYIDRIEEDLLSESEL